jgi:hypothetical protein
MKKLNRIYKSCGCKKPPIVITPQPTPEPIKTN